MGWGGPGEVKTIIPAWVKARGDMRAEARPVTVSSMKGRNAEIAPGFTSYNYTATDLRTPRAVGIHPQVRLAKLLNLRNIVQHVG